MKKYDLKRVTLTILEKGGKRVSDRALYQHIKTYQAEIAKLPKPLDRGDKRFKEWSREINRLRSKTSQRHVETYVFDVFVKQYRQAAIVEWQFEVFDLGLNYRTAFRQMIKEVTNMGIKRVREDRKREPRPVYWGKFVTQFNVDDKKAKGRTFLKAGEVLRIYVEKNLKSLYTDKRPVEPRKYIGIELEFCAPIKENLFAIKLFKSGIHKFAQLKKDGSLRPLDGEVGYELAILLEESNYKKRLKQLIDILTEVKAVAIDRRAGLHVHLDMRRRDKDLVYNNLVACQYALLSIVDPRRTDNEFCRTVDSRKFPTEFTGQREERYKTINAAAFYKYNTLEIRMHEGSVDYTQISNWVDLLVRIANYQKKIKDDVTKVVTLKKRISLDKKLYNYIQDRSCRWQLANTREGDVLRRRILQLEEIEARARRQGDEPDQPRPAPRGAFERHLDEIRLTIPPLIWNTEPNVTTTGLTVNNVLGTVNATVPVEMNPEPEYDYDTPDFEEADEN